MNYHYAPTLHITGLLHSTPHNRSATFRRHLCTPSGKPTQLGRYAFLFLRVVCPIANAQRNQVFTNELKRGSKTFSKRKKNKKASKIRWLRTMPTLNRKSKRLRHNGKANRWLRRVVVLPCHPSGLIPFPFGFFAPPPFQWLSFFSVFFFVKKFWFSAISRNETELISKSYAI